MACKEQDRKTKWEPPLAGWVKLNVDGSFVEQSGESGVGVIARDNEGHVIFSAWRAIFNCQDAAEAEGVDTLHTYLREKEMRCLI